MPKLTIEQREALEKSIIHWKEVCAQKYVTEAFHGGMEILPKPEIGARYCACCNLWNTVSHNWISCCLDCPIYMLTGQKYCEGTPFEAVKDAEENGDLPAFIEAANHELSFLKTLLRDYEQLSATNTSTTAQCSVGNLPVSDEGRAAQAEGETSGTNS